MLNETIHNQIIDLAKTYDISRVTLFGSRARNMQRERSDIDLAVSGGNVLLFSLDVEEKVDTLLHFDVVNLDRHVSDALLDEIARDGVILYEKV